jgi:hypothetical protein
MTQDSGRSWQKVLRMMPRWLIVLVIATAWAALQVGMRFLMGKAIEAEYVALTCALGVAFGVFAVWISGRTQAKERALPPGSPTGTNVTKAMSTGQIPEQASAQEWEAELIWMLIQDRHMVWVGPLMGGLLSAMGVFLALGRPEHPWFGVVFALAFLGMAIWFPVWVRRRRARIQKLLAQLPEEESPRQ